MKKLKITFEASERNGNSAMEQSFELIVANSVAKDLTRTGNTFCKTMVQTIVDIMATLQTEDVFARTLMLDIQEVSNGNY